MKNRLGESIFVSGFNHFVRVNTFRVTAGQSACPNGPTVLSLPDVDSTFAIAPSVATQSLQVTWDHTLPWADIAASVLTVFMGRPQLATRNFFKGPWKVAGSIPGNQTTSPYVMTAPMTLVLGQKVWCYARVSTGPTDSRLSTKFTASGLVVA
jgi:hypothetical protein